MWVVVWLIASGEEEGANEERVEDQFVDGHLDLVRARGRVPWG
jgi:hypothetical protein